MIIPSEKYPKGEKIFASGIQFPEYSEKGNVNFMRGCALSGFYHVQSRTFHIIGEQEFDGIRPTDRSQDMVDFLKATPLATFYCGQDKDVIKRYRKEINFSAGLADVDARIIRYDSLDSGQSRYIIWSKLQDGVLKYSKSGVIFKAINQFAVAKNEFAPSMKALVSLLNGLERKLYNDSRFDHNQ